MIRLFASDLDGTLLNGLHRADPVIRASIRRVIGEGRHFAVATGRSMRSNEEYGFGGLGAEAVCANGAIIWDAQGQLMRAVQIDSALVEELVRAFPHIPFDCTSLRHVYTTETKEVRLASLADRGLFHALRLRALVMGDTGLWRYDTPLAELLRKPIVKLNCRISDLGLRAELSAFLDERSDMLTNAPTDSLLFEITRADVNKGEAVAWLARELGIAEDEVAVYGDGPNDIEMLSRFAAYGHAYATRVACARARAAASACVGSNLAWAVPRHMVQSLRRA